MYEEHGLLLLENELQEIVRLCEPQILKDAADRAMEPYKVSGMTNLAERARQAIIGESQL